MLHPHLISRVIFIRIFLNFLNIRFIVLDFCGVQETHILNDFCPFEGEVRNIIKKEKKLKFYNTIMLLFVL